MLWKLAYEGPLTAAVDATSWQDYLGGIIQFHCETNRNHAVQIVGYDMTGKFVTFSSLISFTLLLTFHNHMRDRRDGILHRQEHVGQRLWHGWLSAHRRGQELVRHCGRSILCPSSPRGGERKLEERTKAQRIGVICGSGIECITRELMQKRGEREERHVVGETRGSAKQKYVRMQIMTYNDEKHE